MNKHLCMILIDILLLIGVGYLFTMCSNVDNNVIKHRDIDEETYYINHYVDTICNNIILTTVVKSKYSTEVNINTLKLNNYDE